MNNFSPRMPLLLSFYQHFSEDQNSDRFISLVNRHYRIAPLEKLARHEIRDVRRGALLALTYLGDYSCNALFGRALHDEDRTVRDIAENGIRMIWGRIDSPENVVSLALISQYNADRNYTDALPLANRLLDQSPWFAEAWHQRGVAHFGLGRLADAIRDCQQALEINPYHFVAASLMAQAYLELENPLSALESFRRALNLNPNLEGVRAQVNRLTRLVGES